MSQKTLTLPFWKPVLFFGALQQTSLLFELLIHTFHLYDFNTVQATLTNAIRISPPKRKKKGKRKTPGHYRNSDYTPNTLTFTYMSFTRPRMGQESKHPKAKQTFYSTVVPLPVLTAYSCFPISNSERNPGILGLPPTPGPEFARWAKEMFEARPPARGSAEGGGCDMVCVRRLKQDVNKISDISIQNAGSE